jgi:hypothetical protein
LLLCLQSPLHLVCHGLWQAQIGEGLFQGPHGPLGTGLFTLEPLALLLEAALPGFLLAPMVSFGLGHGVLLRFVVSPRFSLGGDHDPFFMFVQALS